jgi:tetratricopeptide (TPR) repeat protein
VNRIRARRFLAALAFLTSVAWIPVSAQTPEELFDRGNLAYESGRFEEAAEAYEAAIRYGIRDPRLEYNRGNAAFKLGNLGEAILHYERAYRLDPTDPDIQSNLELARSLRADQVEEPEMAAPIRFVRGIQDRLGPDRQAWMLLALVWIAATLVAWRSARPGGWSPAAGWSLAAIVLVGVLLSASWWVTDRRLARRDLAVVLAESVEVLAGPGQNNAPLFTIHAGLDVTVRAERDDWVQIGLPNRLNGWVPREALGFL